jgi:hypothetical protein
MMNWNTSIDCAFRIIMGLADGKASQLFVPHVGDVMQLVQFLSTPESYKDDLCLQNAVALVGDIVQLMGSDTGLMAWSAVA